MTLSEYLTSLKGKKIAVLGYGISNRPLVKLLAEAGLDVTVRDKGALPEIPGVRSVSGDLRDAPVIGIQRVRKLFLIHGKKSIGALPERRGRNFCNMFAG